MSARLQQHSAALDDLARLAERIINQLDLLDDDPDLEDNGDYEEGGDGDPFVRAAGDWMPGDPADAEDGGGEDLTRAAFCGPGVDEDREMDFENEPSHNAPVSGFGLLGTAAWVPGVMQPDPPGFDPARVIPAMRVLEVPPEGYVAVRVLKGFDDLR